MKVKRNLAILSLVAFLPGCSVFMAADKKGVSAEELISCKSRTCLISKGAEPVNKTPAGEEVFKVQKPTGSTSRAVLNGTLDVLTLGLWEVAGTPIEGSMDKDAFYAIKVTYEKDLETIKHVATN